jgi:hypothetical protein
MGRRQTNGWEVFGGLIGVGLAAGAAYGLHKMMEQAVDQLLACSQEEAIQTLVAKVPSMEEEVWNLFHDRLHSRTQVNQRAELLYVIATSVRNMAPAVDTLLSQPTEQAIHDIIRVVPGLEDWEWQIFQLILGSSLERCPQYRSLISFAINLRQAITVVDQWLIRSPADARRLLADRILDMDESTWNTFHLALKLKTGTNTHAVKLLEYATELRELQDIVEQLLCRSPDDAGAALEGIVPSMEQSVWNTFEALLDGRASISTYASRLLSKARDIHNVSNNVDYLLAQSVGNARAELDQLVPFMEEDAWETFHSILAAKARTHVNANSLLVYAMRVRHMQPIREEEFRQHVRDALADNVITAEETAELDHLRRRLNIKADHAEHIIEEMKQERSRTMVITMTQQPTSSSTSDKTDSDFSEELFRNSIRMALADKVISPEEGAFLEQMRQKMNITADLARQIFNEVQSEATPQPFA